MSSTDELLKAAERNLADAKQQYEHAQQAGGDSSLLAVMKANYENATRNLTNVQRMASLMNRTVSKRPTKPANTTSVAPDQRSLNSDQVKLPDSTATVYFPTLDDSRDLSLKEQDRETVRQAEQWQAEVIRQAGEGKKKAADKPAADQGPVTLTREQYRKQLKKKGGK